MEPQGLEVFAVFFEAGARTMPDLHSTEQLLYFVDGEGIVGTASERRLFRPGGMVIIPAEEWHWHGATATSAVCHLSIRPGGPSTWVPEVPSSTGRPTWRAHAQRKERDGELRSGRLGPFDHRRSGSRRDPAAWSVAFARQAAKVSNTELVGVPRSRCSIFRGQAFGGRCVSVQWRDA